MGRLTYPVFGTLETNCPLGSKSKSRAGFKRKGCGMLKFVRNAFRRGFGALLWINLIIWIALGAVMGGLIGNAIGGWGRYFGLWGHVGLGAFTGFFIGAVVGLLINTPQASRIWPAGATRPVSRPLRYPAPEPAPR